MIHPAPASTATTIRGALADGADSERINRLAVLSGGRPPEGATLLAEVSGDPVAAIGIIDGRAISDPARSSLALRMRLRLLRLGLRAVVAIRGF
jgi:hypothetical protein